MYKFYIECDIYKSDNPYDVIRLRDGKGAYTHAQSIAKAKANITYRYGGRPVNAIYKVFDKDGNLLKSTFPEPVPEVPEPKKVSAPTPEGIPVSVTYGTKNYLAYVIVKQNNPDRRSGYVKIGDRSVFFVWDKRYAFPMVKGKTIKDPSTTQKLIKQVLLASEQSTTPTEESGQICMPGFNS